MWASVAASDFVLNFNKKSWVHKWLCKQLLGRVVWYDLQQLIAAVLAKIEAQNEHPRN